MVRSRAIHCASDILIQKGNLLLELVLQRLEYEQICHNL